MLLAFLASGCIGGSAESHKVENERIYVTDRVYGSKNKFDLSGSIKMDANTSGYFSSYQRSRLKDVLSTQCENFNVEEFNSIESKVPDEVSNYSVRDVSLDFNDASGNDIATCTVKNGSEARIDIEA